MEKREPNLKNWTEIVNKINNPKKEITVAIAGKYTQLNDAYLSVVESLHHTGYQNETKINIKWIASEEITNGLQAKEALRDVDGVIVPGGFGIRGIEGKLEIIRYVRENDIPYLGLCLGMQCAVIEFARNVAGLKDANSTEFDKNAPYKVVHLMEEQKKVKCYGATMRIGAYPCKLDRTSKAFKVYNSEIISERHRHRYEFNNEYRDILASKGLLISGTSPDGMLVEIIENPACSWFVAVQFHPEFKSRLNNPHPLFKGFVETILKKK